MWPMRKCICEGNKALKDLQHMRDLAGKAAKMDNSVYIIYKTGEIYQFCKKGENFNGEMVEYVLP